MARLADRLPENVPGPFFVDDRCIDCDACRQLAPDVFARSPRHGMSYVARQPGDADAAGRALLALVACPTASIGTSPKRDARAAAAAFPLRLEGDVYYCGYHSADSYGAASYLVVRPDGNVLVDSPRAAPRLLDAIARLGGVRWLVLSHRDDVADHDKLVRRFGCARVMHAADAGGIPVEHVIHGREPVALADDLLVIPVPGHTPGSIALLHRDVLFTGDHLWWDEDDARLDMGRGVCWYSWPEQLASLDRLARYRFRHVLPGHGRKLSTATSELMAAELARVQRALAPRL